MTREQFIETLERLRREGTITADEADLLLQAYDAGEITADDLPLTGDEARPDLTDALITALFIALARFLAGTEERAEAVSARMGDMPPEEREELWNEARDEAEQQMDEITRQYKAGDVTLREWHEGMRDAVRDYAAEAAMIGHAGILTAEERGALQADLDEQMGFLRRYADTVAVRAGVDEMDETDTTEVSEGLMLNRSSQYAMLGVAAFWAALRDEESGDGIIARYISQDDGGTCSPCLDADISSPYLPDTVPTPGVVCVANGKCRCRVEFEFNPTVYAQLSG